MAGCCVKLAAAEGLWSARLFAGGDTGFAVKCQGVEIIVDKSGCALRICCQVGKVTLICLKE